MDTPKAVFPSFSLSLYPRTYLNDCHTTLQKKLSSEWGDPKEGGRRWEPCHQETRSPEHSAKLFQPGDPTILWGHEGWLCCRRVPWIWRLWAHAEGNRQSKSMGWGVGGCLPGKPSPAPSAPGQSRLGTQACSDSRHVTPAQVAKARWEQSQQLFSLF